MRDRWKPLWEKGKRWLFPTWKIALPLVAVCAAALVYIFWNDYEESPAACAVFALSFYALVAGTGAAVRAGRGVWLRIAGIPAVERWRGDARWRVRVGLVLSLLVNLCYAGVSIVGAVLYASVWEGAVGVYYLLLCAVRIFLIRRMPASAETSHYPAELRTYRWTGWLLIGLGLTLTGIAVQIVKDGQRYDYPGLLIYAAAAYSFYCLTLAIVNAARYRRFHSPVLSAAKAVSLTCALVSIFSLETAMLAQFGGEARFQFTMTFATAAAVCTLVLLLAIHMVISASRQLKQK